MRTEVMFATPVYIETVKNEHEVACRKAEAAQRAYLAEIAANGKTQPPRHRLSALRVAYHKASTNAENLARQVAELTLR